MLSRVDLPQPEWPMIEAYSPCSIVILILRSTSVVLEPRVKVCLDVCCMTDFEELIKANGLSGHGIYYYVPSLLKHFQTAEINELIVPRAHLSLNGRLDDLTPPKGVEKIRDYLMPLYRKYGKETDCRIALYDCKHVELPEMRELILEWMDRHLVEKAVA